MYCEKKIRVCFSTRLYAKKRHANNLIINRSFDFLLYLRKVYNTLFHREYNIFLFTLKCKKKEKINCIDCMTGFALTFFFLKALLLLHFRSRLNMHYNE